MDYVINLLQRHLKNLEYDLKRSKDECEGGNIPNELHQVHLDNLNPKIKELHKAIIALKNEP